jgi:hypothetical protein
VDDAVDDAVDGAADDPVADADCARATAGNNDQAAAPPIRPPSFRRFTDDP